MRIVPLPEERYVVAMNPIRPLVLCGLLLTGLAQSACSAERREIRRDKLITHTLSDSARLYWDFVRWGDSDRAANFIDGESLVSFYQWFEVQQTAFRIEEVQILRVTLDPDLEEEAPRSGTVVVRTHGYTYPAQLLHSETLSQHWVQGKGGWFLDWEQ
ncbi:MAG: hypothetical protein QGG40_02975 [Myxococcota bacterium]|nr:hypothetical protein [Myxococcota bacterium]